MTEQYNYLDQITAYAVVPMPANNVPRPVCRKAMPLITAASSCAAIALICVA